MFANKVLTREAAEERYGHIDFTSGHWAQQDSWMRALHIPEGMFPHWKVMDTEHVVRSIYCNIDIHVPLMAALNAVHDKGLSEQLHTFDGCFNIRMVRGSKAFSTHCYGLGLDINAKTNPMSSVLHTTFTPEFVKCFTDQGFAWGGNFQHRKDPMHFSRAWEG